jgi:hypothetical protein
LVRDLAVVFELQRQAEIETTPTQREGRERQRGEQGQGE